MKSSCWRPISLADWHCYETAQDEGDATDRERQGEASGPFANEAEEIRPNSAPEIAGTVDEPDADPGDGWRQHLRWQAQNGPKRPKNAATANVRKRA